MNRNPQKSKKSVACVTYANDQLSILYPYLGATLNKLSSESEKMHLRFYLLFIHFPYLFFGEIYIIRNLCLWGK